jgi:hypothetical protein
LQAFRKADVSLGLRADLEFLPVATSCVERAAHAFGIGEAEALAITLAAEEIFAYLTRTAAPGQDIRILCREGGYYVELDFLFHARDFNMRAFNLTATVSLENPALAEETGLLIASRMVDRFRFLEEDGGIRLMLIKEKSYPAGYELHGPQPVPLTDYEVRNALAEEIKILTHLANERYRPHTFPTAFAFPGKIVDMVASGEYRAIIAADKAGHVGGGLLWRQGEGRLVEFFGPYLFNQSAESDMAPSLVDFCINAVARTHAVALINRYPTAELPLEYFEPLASVTFLQHDGHRERIMAYHRLLEEDPGLSVWAHPSMEAFLSEEYRRLAFAREILQVTEAGESQSPFSVLSAEIDRESGRATLRPVWWGRDFRATLHAHVQTLLNEDLPNIFFVMDLGESWHCRCAPALASEGFQPSMLLPHAGKADLLVFQHDAHEGRS